MSLRDVYAVAGRAIALLAAALVVVVLALSVVVPRLGGATAYTILTGSMRPAMPPGTLVVVKPTDPANIRTGDVITYQLESGKPMTATHRVIGVGTTLGGEYRFTVKGDANSAADRQPVAPEQIRGVRWYAVPYLAYPSLVVDGNIRQVIVMGAVAVLLLYAAASFIGAARDRRRGDTVDSSDSPSPADEAERTAVGAVS